MFTESHAPSAGGLGGWGGELGRGLPQQLGPSVHILLCSSSAEHGPAHRASSFHRAPTLGQVWGCTKGFWEGPRPQAAALRPGLACSRGEEPGPGEAARHEHCGPQAETQQA